MVFLCFYLASTLVMERPKCDKEIDLVKNLNIQRKLTAWASMVKVGSWLGLALAVYGTGPIIFFDYVTHDHRWN